MSIISLKISKYLYASICVHCRFKWKTEAQAIFLNPFTVFSSCKRKFVVCLFDDKEKNESYLFAIGLKGLNGLNRLAHLCIFLLYSYMV
jgi:hypothetical protein